MQNYTKVTTRTKVPHNYELSWS